MKVTRYLATAAVAALALTACGGSAAPLAASDVIPKLEAAGIDCTETAEEPVEEGIAATAVTCALGDSGGIVTIVAESADEITKAKAELCAQIPDEQGNLELAAGETWLSVTLSTVGVGASQVAEALGGQVAKIKDYCA
ncbi:MAG: hypothetical protein RL347_513 [Actinomycetota bacterium]|jgi:hypothetical protein